ncbi:hypothetical protein [Streptococcus oralis]|nr:hypothetical protein [Streptococcus oralis]
MTLAWEIAKRGAKRFGGSTVEYIAEAIKIAWGIVKSEQEETEHYNLKQWRAVEAKMRQAGKYGYANMLGEAKEVHFNEVMHKAGAYYGIEVIADGSNYGTYYIAEKAWA